jgi:hypothetical protein
MSTTVSRWFVPAVGFVLGLLIAAAEMGHDASPLQAALAFALVAAYAIALRALQSRSDMASLLSGLPRDERWESINLRALSLAAQVIAAVLVAAFLVTRFAGGDATPYAWPGIIFAVAYLGGLVWYRSRS